MLPSPHLNRAPAGAFSLRPVRFATTSSPTRAVAGTSNSRGVAATLTDVAARSGELAEVGSGSGVLVRERLVTAYQRLELAVAPRQPSADVPRDDRGRDLLAYVDDGRVHVQFCAGADDDDGGIDEVDLVPERVLEQQLE